MLGSGSGIFLLDLEASRPGLLRTWSSFKRDVGLLRGVDTRQSIGMLVTMNHLFDGLSPEAIAVVRRRGLGKLPVLSKKLTLVVGVIRAHTKVLHIQR